jgi:hypothetical protein
MCTWPANECSGMVQKTVRHCTTPRWFQQQSKLTLHVTTGRSSAWLITLTVPDRQGQHTSAAGGQRRQTAASASTGPRNNTRCIQWLQARRSPENMRLSATSA